MLSACLLVQAAPAHTASCMTDNKGESLMLVACKHVRIQVHSSTDSLSLHLKTHDAGCLVEQEVLECLMFHYCNDDIYLSKEITNVRDKILHVSHG